MKISDITATKKPIISFEIFPPKKEAAFLEIDRMLGDLAVLKPDFISVTYGAGGSGGRNKTAEVARKIQREFGVSSVAHLTCIGSKKEEILRITQELNAMGIENILALRGDLPETPIEHHDYLYVKDLIHDLDKETFCVGGAAYPEGHIDCTSQELNIEHLYQKQEAGAEFFMTQLFFENDLFFRFYEGALKRGVVKPILPGIMPMMSRSQVERMIFMCAASLPSEMIKLLNRYKDSPEDLQKAGVEYASRQIRGLLDHGVDGVHLYTMNKPEFARQMLENGYADR